EVVGGELRAIVPVRTGRGRPSQEDGAQAFQRIPIDGVPVHESSARGWAGLGKPAARRGARRRADVRTFCRATTRPPSRSQASELSAAAATRARSDPPDLRTRGGRADAAMPAVA